MVYGLMWCVVWMWRLCECEKFSIPNYDMHIYSFNRTITTINEQSM